MKQSSIKKNTLLNAINTSSTIIFPLITFPYLSRVLLPINLGKINFGLSIISYFSLIASLGITTYAIRECSFVRYDREKLDSIASQIFSINIITTIIAYLLLGITLLTYKKLHGYAALIVVHSLSIITTTLGTDWLYSAMEDFKYITIRTLIFKITSLILVFSFIHQPEDYMKYLVITVILSIGISFTNIFYRKRYCKIYFTKEIYWKKHFQPIFFLFVMLLAQNIFTNVDSTMLGLMHGDREVGIYSTAIKIYNTIEQLLASLLWVIMPRMSYYFAEDKYGNINQLLRKILGFDIFLGFPCAVGVFMLSSDIISIIAGNNFADSSTVLQICMISFILGLFGGDFLGNAILLPSKREKLFMVICCITAVVNVITNYMLIPVLGARGAALTTALCLLLMLILLLITVDKKIKLQNLSSLFISPILGCLGIFVVCMLAKNINGLWLRFSVSTIFSGIVYFLVNYIGKNELLLELLNRNK